MKNVVWWSIFHMIWKWFDVWRKIQKIWKILRFMKDFCCHLKNRTKSSNCCFIWSTFWSTIKIFDNDVWETMKQITISTIKRQWCSMQISKRLKFSNLHFESFYRFLRIQVYQSFLFQCYRRKNCFVWHLNSFNISAKFYKFINNNVTKCFIFEQKLCNYINVRFARRLIDHTISDNLDDFDLRLFISIFSEFSFFIQRWLVSYIIYRHFHKISIFHFFWNYWSYNTLCFATNIIQKHIEIFYCSTCRKQKFIIVSTSRQTSS